MARQEDLDFGDKASSLTVNERGIIASGKPTSRATLHACKHLSTAGGLANPMSS